MAPSQNTDAAETALMVEQLGDLIRTNLRQCDVAARYTDMPVSYTHLEQIALKDGVNLADKVQRSGSNSFTLPVNVDTMLANGSDSWRYDKEMCIRDSLHSQQRGNDERGKHPAGQGRHGGHG